MASCTAAELFERISHGPQCLFDVHGELSLFLEAFFWVGIDLGFSEITLFEARERFVDEIIVEFDWECVHQAPEQIARHTGTELELAYSGNNSAGQHAYTVTSLGADDRDAALEKWTIESLFRGGFLDFDYYTSTELSALTARLDNLSSEDNLIVVSTGQRVQVFGASTVSRITSAGTFQGDFYRLSKLDGLVDSIDLNAGAGDDLVEITLADNAAGGNTGVTVMAGDGNDIVSIFAGSETRSVSNLILDGEDGDDRLKVTASFAANIVMQGGLGNDTLMLDGDDQEYNALCGLWRPGQR